MKCDSRVRARARDVCMGESRGGLTCKGGIQRWEPSRPAYEPFRASADVLGSFIGGAPILRRACLLARSLGPCVGQLGAGFRPAVPGSCPALRGPPSHPHGAFFCATFRGGLFIEAFTARVYSEKGMLRGSESHRPQRDCLHLQVRWLGAPIQPSSGLQTWNERLGHQNYC